MASKSTVVRYFSIFAPGREVQVGARMHVVSIHRHSKVSTRLLKFVAFEINLKTRSRWLFLLPERNTILLVFCTDESGIRVASLLCSISGTNFTPDSNGYFTVIVQLKFRYSSLFCIHLSPPHCQFLCLT